MSSQSFRTTLRSFSVLGGAQAISLVANVLKMKAAALLLGPVGVGLIGLYSSLFQTAATIAALGIDSAGTRQLATDRSTGDGSAVGRTRRVIVRSGLALAVVGAFAFLASSHHIARLVSDGHSPPSDIAWLSIGVALTVIVASQTAVITGLHRVGDLARINVGASVVGTIASVTALWIWRDEALIVVVLIAPACTALFTYLYVIRLGRPAGGAIGTRALVAEAAPILRVGIYAMLGVVLLQIGFLIVRASVQHRLGPGALGQFQAAWAIGVAYQALIIASMASDYFPRLTSAIKDRVQATRLINEQTEVGLLMCTPLILALMSFAPWVLHAFYSSEFSPAAEVLRWQLLGDLVKMLYYPAGYALFAMGLASLFSLNQLLAVSAMVAGAVLGVPVFGLQATGAAYLLMYSVFFPLPWFVLRRKMDFRWSRAVCWQAATGVFAAVSVFAAARHSPLLGAVYGGILTIVSVVWSFLRLTHVAGRGGRLNRWSSIQEKVRRKTGPSR